MNASEKVKYFFESYPLRTLQNGDVFLRPGDNRQVFYVESGLVLQYDISKAGEKLVVNIYKPGSFLPLPSIVADVEGSFFFESRGTTVVRVAPITVVRTLLKEDADIAYDALARMARGVDGLLQRIAHTMEGGAEDRILHELVMLLARFPDEKREVTITLTQLSEQTGLARETVSRAVKRMCEKGVIRRGRGKFVLNV